MKRILAAVVPAVLAASAIIPYLLDLGYGAAEAEVLLTGLGVAVLFGALGLLLRNVPRIHALLPALLVYWTVDAYFATNSYMFLMTLLGAAVLYAGLITRFAENLRPMLLTFGILWLASNVLTPRPSLIDPPLVARLDGSDNSLPPVVHFIIDEQMSPAALPATIPPSHPAAAILGDYLGRGFDVHEHARSVSHLSRESIGNLVSLMDDSQNFVLTRGKFSYHTKDNRYFAALAARGYRIIALQSTYFALCTDDTQASCHDYSRAGHGKVIAKRLDSIPARVGFAISELHHRMNHEEPSVNVLLYRMAMFGLRRLGLPFDSPESYSRPAATLAILDEMTTQLDAIQPGHAYVYHLLLPHTPYNLDSECRIKPPAEWTRGIGDRLHVFPIEKIYAGYWDQAACTHTRMMEIIDRVIASDAGRNAIIMVHGDHGARLTWEGAKEQDPADMLETFLAIRAPGTSGKALSEQVNLQRTFKDAVVRDIGLTLPTVP